MSLYVKLYSKLVALTDRYFTSIRRNKLKRQDYTIICNNCWGGYVYRRYGLPYRSPTVGLYFFADDFVKLCGDLKHYMEEPLQFIYWKESKYKDVLEQYGQIKVPIARLQDLEIIFLHYSSEKEAEEKWNRRVKRINYDHLIFKFSKMNGCTEEHLRSFDRLPYDKKICFVPPEDYGIISCGVSFKSAAGKNQVENDSTEYARYINLTRMINAKKVCGNHME